MSATCETALVAMGQADKMVCTSAFANGEFSFTYKLFPEFANVEKVKGGLSNEELIARGVDVVFVKSKSNVEKLNEAGITVSSTILSRLRNPSYCLIRSIMTLILQRLISATLISTFL